MLLEGLGLIILVNLVFFLRTLRYSFTSDDAEIKREVKPYAKGWKHIWCQFRGNYYTTAESAHLTNIIVHTVVCCLMFLMCGANKIALLATLLFTFNPITSQVAVWISGRGYSTSTALILASFTLPILAPILILITPWFTASAVLSTLPFVLTKHWFLIFLFPLWFHITFAYKATLTDAAFRRDFATKPMKEFRPYKLIIMVKTFAYYFINCLLPRRLGIFHTFMYAFGLTTQDTEKYKKLDRWFWTGIVLAVGSVVTIAFNLTNPIGFGLFWFVVNIGAYTNWITIQQPVAERYCYLPLVGLMYALAYVIAPYPYVWLILLTYYITRYNYHIDSYRDNMVMYKSNISIHNHPDQWFVYALKGNSERERGRCFSALDTWYEGLLVKPDEQRLHFRVARTCAELGFYKEALAHFNEIKDDEYYDIPSGISESIPALKKYCKKKLKDRLNARRDSVNSSR